MEEKTRREKIFAEIEIITRILVYGDKSREPDLPEGSVHEAVRLDEISIPEMAAYFEVALIQMIPLPVDLPGQVGQAAHMTRSQAVAEQVSRLRDES